MKNFELHDAFVTGIGVTSAVGQGKADFISSLLHGQRSFDVMRRPGRQVECTGSNGDSRQRTEFLGAEISDLLLPDAIPEQLLRTASFSARVALATLHEAWSEAELSDIDPTRIGLIVGGSNFQQRELMQVYEAYRHRIHFLRPTYGMMYMDSDVCGLCTEAFGIGAFAYTLGGASASGQLAVIQGVQAVKSGRVDVCIAMGALADISCWECQGFRSLGAMGSDRYAKEPMLACRPFDSERDGFIYGESCGAVVIEGRGSVERRGITSYARFGGCAIATDGNRNPNPSFEGEVGVIQEALKEANLTPGEVDYINSHGTGSVIGDEIELRAIRHCGLDHAFLNATKSIIGHGLSAAGTVEIIAALLQMKEGFLHPTVNLDKPIEPSYNWVRLRPVRHVIENTLKLSMGFGGINSAVCLKRH